MDTIQEFEIIYRREYEQELEHCERWSNWCDKFNDTHGVNFFEGMRAAHIFNNVQIEKLLSMLQAAKQKETQSGVLHQNVKVTYYGKECIFQTLKIEKSCEPVTHLYIECTIIDTPTVPKTYSCGEVDKCSD